jgi:hypothetical protein
MVGMNKIMAFTLDQEFIGAGLRTQQFGPPRVYIEVFLYGWKGRSSTVKGPDEPAL